MNLVPQTFVLLVLEQMTPVFGYHRDRMEQTEILSEELTLFCSQISCNFQWYPQSDCDQICNKIHKNISIRILCL